jgi:two-component system CheB/CheR fusion protein
VKKTGKPDGFPVVAIGASAGGLSAFEALLNALPAEPGAAFVLVPHLAPQFKSHLAEILARCTKLPVSEVKSNDKVAPNRIYVVPPNRTMLIKDGVLKLAASPRTSSRHHPIDVFFRSMADDQRQKAVGVLLSGAGTDGTAGLQAIKERGGTTFAQDGATAAHLSMPHSAVVSGCVDFVLAAAEIGKRLGLGAAGKSPRAMPKAEETLNQILELLRTAKGVEFGLYKRNTLRRRIQRRMTIMRVREPEKYLRLLKKDSAEVDAIFNDILISVTSFFREPESFRALKSAIYPRLLKNRADNTPIRLWVPGCSTGEEAYSHAMNLVEFLGKRAAQIPIQIFATDLNPAVIDKARVGLYAKKSAAGVSPERLRRFFIETEDGYRVAPFLREKCVFAVHNVVQDPPFTSLDLISCRNLMIYLGPSLQEKALQIFQYSLKPGGLLMLGRSETVGDFSSRFSTLDEKRKVFSVRAAALNARLDFVQPSRFLETEPAFKDSEQAEAIAGAAPAQAFDLQGQLDGILPARYVPNGVIVNAELEILRFLGDTTAYLRPAPGKPSLNLRRMANGEFLLELRAAIQASKQSACVVRKEIAAPRVNGTVPRVRVEVLPIKIAVVRKDYFLVLFEECAPERPDRRQRPRPGQDSRRVIELKENLAVSGQHLKSIIDEQEATNLRLKSSNESLLSTNEELQSINEEFETTKEELQSTNEELQSRNEELTTSTDEVVRGNQVLSRVNNDLSNLLANINIPVVLLDLDLVVHRFTPAAEKILGLSADMIGRSIVDIKLPLLLPNLKQLLLSVIKTNAVQKLEVRDAQGRWYYLLIRAYRTDKSKTEKSRTEGAVMTLIDIHDRKLSEKAVQRLAAVVLDSNDAVIICDLKDRISAWNFGARKMYGYSESEALGMSIKLLTPVNKRIRARELVRVSAAPIETQRRTRDGRILDVLLTVTVLRDEKGQPVEVATTERDITELKRADREMLRLHARVTSAQETERKRLARELHDGVGQILSGVKFRLQALPGQMTLSGGAEAKILKVGGFLDHAIAEIRRVSQNLMPAELVDLGLEPALLTLCREFKERSGVHVNARTVAMDVEPDLGLALFRIAQETLNNIGKHSKATRVELGLSLEGKEIVLTVSDNGVGFTPGGRPTSGRGIGLGNMRQRAESVGGSCEIASRSGAGTTVRVRVPLSGLRG